MTNATADISLVLADATCLTADGLNLCVLNPPPDPEEPPQSSPGSRRRGSRLSKQDQYLLYAETKRRKTRLLTLSDVVEYKSLHNQMKTAYDLRVYFLDKRAGDFYADNADAMSVTL